MAIPANAIPEVEAIRLRKLFTGLRNEAVNLVTECDTGTVKLGDLVSARLQAFINYKDEINTISGISGVGAAYENLYTESFTFTTEKDAIINAVQDLIDYIVTQIPKSGVYITVLEFDVDYKLTQRTTSASTPVTNLKNDAQAVVDLITV